MKPNENGIKYDYSLLKPISVLYVEDDDILREKVLEYLRMRFDNVYSASNGREGLAVFQGQHPDVVVTDIKMPVMNGLEMARYIKTSHPKTPVIILTAFSEVSFLMEAIEVGVEGYVQKPTDGIKLIDTIYRSILPVLQEREIEDLDHDIQFSLEGMMGKSPSIRNIIKQIRQVSKSNFSVIIQGETGVGKTLIANTIHNLSKRADKPFVTVDIGAMPDTLVESELFGYKKGAFTGAARDKKGFFETGSGGTVFLDELENMNPYVQGKILRAVEERKIYPLGSTTPVSIDIRIIGATNKDLALEVKEKHFRQDLFYRLCEFSIDVPPLRERIEDIPMLAKKFYRDAASELEKNIKFIDDDALELLIRYPWAGNIRELKNSMRRIALICEKDRISAKDVKKILSESKETEIISPIQTEEKECSEIPFYPLSLVEKWAIQKALHLTKGKKLNTASLLEIDYKTLISKIKKYGLS